jgi:hypothetical protein
MKNLSGFLKRTTMLALVCLSGCISMEKTPVATPATLADLKNELSLTAQRLQGVAELQHKEFNQQQSALAAQLNTELVHMHEAISMLDRKIISLHTTTPATVVISEEKCPAPPPGQTPDGKLLLGEAEWLWLETADQAFQARIDTGAATSSISAADITSFERNGKDWVRFFMSHQGMDDRIQIEAPLVRYVRVRQASAEGIDRRPVVRLSVRVGEQNEITEFTLTDRSNMTFPVLLGRDFLKDIAVVDVARKYIQTKPQPRDAR